jgi:hypothetical protein
MSACLRYEYATLNVPAPGNILYERTTNYRTDDTADGPSTEDHSKKLRPLPQWYNIAEHYLCDGDDATATNSLD